MLTPLPRPGPHAAPGQVPRDPATGEQQHRGRGRRLPHRFSKAAPGDSPTGGARRGGPRRSPAGPAPPMAAWRTEPRGGQAPPGRRRGAAPSNPRHPPRRRGAATQPGPLSTQRSPHSSPARVRPRTENGRASHPRGRAASPRSPPSLPFSRCPPSRRNPRSLAQPPLTARAGQRPPGLSPHRPAQTAPVGGGGAARQRARGFPPGAWPGGWGQRAPAHPAPAASP